MRRPYITKAAVDGLKEIEKFVSADFETVANDDPEAHPEGTADRLLRGIIYIRELIDWYESRGTHHDG